MISLDQEKASDHLNWQDKVMQKMNFGEGFWKWAHLLYTNVNCIVTNNGHTSQPIKLTRGARQGSPVSPLLYIIVAKKTSIPEMQESRHRQPLSHSVKSPS